MKTTMVTFGSPTELYQKQKLEREIKLFYNNFTDKMQYQLNNIMNKYSYEDIRKAWIEIHWNKSIKKNQVSLYLLINELKRVNRI